MKIGIICDLSATYNIAIQNFWYTLNNIFHDVKMVKNVYDLKGLEYLFIGNEHYIPHKSVWNNKSFIDECNRENIKVIVWCGEQIHTPFYPNNLESQKSIEMFKNCYQVVMDVNDAKILNKEIISTPFSYNFSNLKKKYDKIDRMCFVGSLSTPWYQKRVDTIEELKKIYDFDVFENKFQTYQEYINLLSKYKFVLNPHSMELNGFSGRFYETLLVNSIPVQQVYNNTLDYYTVEREYKDVIYFEDVDEIVEKIKKCDLDESYSTLWFEDVLIKFFETRMNFSF